MQRIKNCLLLSLTAALAANVGCSKDKGDNNGNDHTATAGGTTEKSTAPKKKAAAPKLIDYDLSPAGDEWKGWIASGPEGCKAMGDLGKSSRLACKGPGIADESGHNGFDIIFHKGHEDLAEYKASVKERWAEKEAKGEHEVLTDEPGLLAWKSGGSEYGAFHFKKHLTVGEDKFTCSTNLMIGAGAKEEYEQLLAGCDTLKKAP